VKVDRGTFNDGGKKEEVIRCASGRDVGSRLERGSIQKTAVKRNREKLGNLPKRGGYGVASRFKTRRKKKLGGISKEQNAEQRKKVEGGLSDEKERSKPNPGVD